jgi:hypothetical protein
LPEAIFISQNMRNKVNLLINELIVGWKFYSILIVIIISSSFLNWNADLMKGILPYYSNFSSYFLNGFSYGQLEGNIIFTWPMWGYGLILLLKFKVLIIAIQQLLTFFVIVIVRLYFKSRVDYRTYKFVSILILFALPWYFFQVSLWPYGISGNLLTLSLIFLSIGLEKLKFRYVAYSALSFGIMLNFRSDYFYFPFLIGFAVFLLIEVYGHSKKVILYISIWFFIIISTLVPWAIHSYKYSDKFSFVSSNSGHVFYISLGQLPNNKWNITPSDEDSTMRKFIDSKISVNESTLSSKSNTLLMDRFIQLVKNDPNEYFKKCIYNFKSFIVNPFYTGSVYSDKVDISKFKPLIKIQIRENNYLNALRLFYDAFGVYIIFPLCLYIINLAVMVLVLLSTFNYFKRLNKFRDFKILNLFIFLVLLYQIALSVFAYHMPIYSTNIFLLLVILIGCNLNEKSVLN